MTAQEKEKMNAVWKVADEAEEKCQVIWKAANEAKKSGMRRY